MITNYLMIIITKNLTGLKRFVRLLAIGWAETRPEFGGGNDKNNLVSGGNGG